MASLADRIGTSQTQAVKRTMRGKIVGSAPKPMEAWYYHPLGNGWVVCAPSGARWTVHDNEADAFAEVVRRNAEEVAAG